MLIETVLLDKAPRDLAVKQLEDRRLRFCRLLELCFFIGPIIGKSDVLHDGLMIQVSWVMADSVD